MLPLGDGDILPDDALGCEHAVTANITIASDSESTDAAAADGREGHWPARYTDTMVDSL